MPSSAQRSPRRDSFARGWAALLGVLAPHVPATGAPVAADRDQQRGGSPAQRLVGQPPGHGVPRRALAPAAAAPLVSVDDPARQHGPITVEALPRDLKSELVEPAEDGQIRAAEAGRRGSVAHVEVFRMGSVRTSILGRPRRLLRDRRASPIYTLSCEEPVNQLRHTLELAFPGAVGLFFDLHSSIARAFLRRFPTAAEAAALDEEAMAAWLAAEGYCGRTPAEVFIDRLRTAPAGLIGAEAAARRHVTLALLAGIDAIEEQAAELGRRIKEALALHPDAPIFTRLPRAGQVRAAALLAEIGDARGRYPDPQSLAAAAGVCPFTDESGKHRAVGFRYKVDTKLRRALTDFADDSRHAHPWAADIYARARSRGMRHPHAVRVLARAWTLVICRCWQDHQPYDPDRHGALNRYLTQQDTAAAA
jgi:transposase